MFGMYTTVRKYPMEKAVNLQRGSFLNMKENKWSPRRLVGFWKNFSQKNGNIKWILQCQIKSIPKTLKFFRLKQARIVLKINYKTYLNTLRMFKINIWKNWTQWMPLLYSSDTICEVTINNIEDVLVYKYENLSK